MPDLLAVLCPAAEVARELLCGAQLLEHQLVELQLVGRSDGLLQGTAQHPLVERERRRLVLERRHVPATQQRDVTLKLLLGVAEALTVVAGRRRAGHGCPNGVEQLLELVLVDVGQVPLSVGEQLGLGLDVHLLHQPGDGCDLTLCIRVVTQGEEVVELRRRQHDGVPHVGLEPAASQLLVDVEQLGLARVELVGRLREELLELVEVIEQRTGIRELVPGVVSQNLAGQADTKDELDDGGDRTVTPPQPAIDRTVVLLALEVARRLHARLVDAELLRDERVGQQVEQLGRERDGPRAGRVACEQPVRHHLGVDDARVGQLERGQPAALRADGVGDDRCVECHLWPPVACEQYSHLTLTIKQFPCISNHNKKPPHLRSGFYKNSLLVNEVFNLYARTHGGTNSNGFHVATLKA